MEQRFWEQRFWSLAGAALLGLWLGQAGLAQTAGSDTVLLEQRLKDLGYLSGPMDGKSDPALIEALKRFQTLHGLVASGDLGKLDRAILFSSAARPAPGRPVVAQLPQAQTPQTQTPAPVAKAAPAPAAPPPANTSALGSFYAEMTCKVGRNDTTFETEFTISPHSAGTFAMQMVVSSPDSMVNGTSDIRYLGEVQGSEIRFVVEKQVRASIFGRSSNRSGGEFRFDPATRRMQPADAACKPFVARRMDQADPRLVVTVPAPVGRGSFYAATTERDRCEALIAWVDRANREFPGRDFYRQNRRGDDWILIKLFADDDFVPVFGLPFDSMPLEARREVWQFAQRTCSRDPFTRDRMELYRAAADRVLPGDPDRQLTSNGYSATLFAIRQIRALRNELRALAAGSARPLAGDSFADTVQRMDRVRAMAGKDDTRLWPTEVAAVGASIDGFLAGQATAEATRFLQGLVAEADPARGLKALADHRAAQSQSGYFARYLTQENRASLTSQISQLEQRFADALSQPLMARAKAAPAGLEGARQLEALLAEVAGLSGLPDSRRGLCAAVCNPCAMPGSMPSWRQRQGRLPACPPRWRG